MPLSMYEMKKVYLAYICMLIQILTVRKIFMCMNISVLCLEISVHVHVQCMYMYCTVYVHVLYSVRMCTVFSIKQDVWTMYIFSNGWIHVGQRNSNNVIPHFVISPLCCHFLLTNIPHC